MTIFRLVRELERRGHQCAIYLFDPFRLEHRPAHELRDEILTHFIPIRAPIFVGLDGFDSADVAVATNWWTAYAVRDLPRCVEKAYLVQDYEPDFHAKSAQSLWAEETYRMGLRCLAFTPWLVEILKERFDADASWFEFGTDTRTYRFASYEDRLPEVVAVYGRRETERRAVDLSLAGLATLLERRPSVHVVLFGSAQPARLPFPCDDLGIVSPGELATLYRRASVGIALSLTNLSLVSLEMLASGLPLVELDSPNVKSVLGESGELALLAEPTPDGVAEMVERALDDPAGAAKRARRARNYVEERSWGVSGAGLERLLGSFVSEPRVSGVIRADVTAAIDAVVQTAADPGWVESAHVDRRRESV
jgi:glycosyltransferase involved in cell wall biosynthesis